MSNNKVAVDERFLEKLSGVYTSIEQGVNSSVAMWSNTKKFNQRYIFYSLNKNECMYLVEFLAGLEECIDFNNESNTLLEVKNIMKSDVNFQCKKELASKWGCNFIRIKSGFFELFEVCQYIIIEWAIMYREYNEEQKKAFETYIEDLNINKRNYNY